MPPVGLCFADVTFLLKCRPSHSTTGGRIATRIVALTQSMKKYYGYKFGKLGSSNPWRAVKLCVLFAPCSYVFVFDFSCVCLFLLFYYCYQLSGEYIIEYVNHKPVRFSIIPFFSYSLSTSLKTFLNSRKHKTSLHVSLLVPFSPVDILFSTAPLALHWMPH